MNDEMTIYTADREDVIASLKNKTLKAAIKREFSYIDNARKTTWQETINIGSLSNEHIKDDFASESDFARFIGQPQQIVNKKRRIVPFADLFQKWNVLPTIAFELLPVIDDIVSIIDEDGYIIYGDSQFLGCHISALTQKDVRILAKEFKGNTKQIADNGGTDEPEDVPTSSENESEYKTWSLSLPIDLDTATKEFVMESVILDYTQMKHVVKFVKKLIHLEE